MKRNKCLSRTLAVIMAFAMVLGLGATAFAANQTAPTAVITAKKIFNADIAANVTKLATADFVLSPHSVTGTPTGSGITTTNMPMPATGTQGTGAGRYATVNTPLTASGATTAEGSKAFGAISFPIAGIYTYKLQERIPGVTDATGSAPSGTKVPGVTYDTAAKYVSVYVQNDVNAAGVISGFNDNGTPYVKVTQIIVYGSEATIGSSTQGDKLEVAGNTGAVTASFTNTFGTTAAERLEVNKVVGGAAGDTAAQFSFNFTTNGDSVAYQVLNASNAVVTDGGNKSGSGKTFTFNLKHGEKVRIYGLATGDIYTVTETGATDYTTAISGKATSSTKVSGNVTFGGTADTLTFTNTKGATPPTGIAMDIMPFAVMIVLAGLGVMLMLTKKRQKRNDD